MLNQFTASLWGDEGFSAILSMKSIPNIIEIIIRDTSPPLYNITEHIAFQLFGTEEIVIRGLSFFYYCLAIYFVYKIGLLLWDKKTALMAGALSFLNPFFFIYAFEGRMYSIMALGVAASMYFFLAKKWPLYVLATVWALYSHHFAFFAVFVQGIWFLYELFFGKKKEARSMLLSFLAIGVLYTPWLIPLYNQTKMVGGGFWLGTPTLKDFFNLVFEYLAKGIKHNLAQSALTILLFTLAARRWHQNPKKTLFLLSWFIIPIALAWFISQVFQSIFFNRYLLYTIPAAMLLVASQRRKIISIVLLGILFGLFIKIDTFYFTHPIKHPFRELAAYVKEQRVGGDYLINWNSSSHHLWETKYYGIGAPIYIPKDGGNLPFFVGTALMEENDIVREIPENTKRIIAVTSGPVEEVQIDGYTKNEVVVFGALKVIWLER